MGLTFGMLCVMFWPANVVVMCCSSIFKTLAACVAAVYIFTAIQHTTQTFLLKNNSFQTETHKRICQTTEVSWCWQNRCVGSLPSPVHPFILSCAGGSGMRGHSNCKSHKCVCSNYALCSVSTVHLSIQQQFKALLRWWFSAAGV